MRNIPIKAIGDKFYTYDCNSISHELENAITGIGITLADGDLYQLGEAIAGYAGVGDFYQESGIANAYVLSAIGDREAPVTLYDGLRVRFLTSNASTAASTINVATLGPVPIKKFYNGANSGSHPVYVDIGINDIIPHILMELVYNASIAAFVLIYPYTKRQLVKIVSNNYNVLNSDDKMRLYVDTSGMTITLPNTIDVANTFSCTIKNISAGSVTISPGTGTIDGQSALSLSYPEDCVTIQATDSSNTWRILSSHFPQGASEFKTGDFKTTMRASADPGWILYNTTGTIGSASSGATIRANADCQSLFTLLWTNCANAQCPVVGGRGASALADWTANKQLTLPAIFNNVIGVSGGSIPLGYTEGVRTHTISINELPSHSHTVNDPTHSHNVSDPSHGHAYESPENYTSRDGPTAQGGPFGKSTQYSYASISLAGSYTGITLQNTGLSNAMPIVQPTVYVNIMMKL